MKQFFKYMSLIKCKIISIFLNWLIYVCYLLCYMFCLNGVDWSSRLVEKKVIRWSCFKFSRFRDDLISKKFNSQPIYLIQKLSIETVWLVQV